MVIEDFQLTKPIPAPGELLIKFTPEGQKEISNAIPPGPLRRSAAFTASAFGISKLDDVLGQLGVTAINKVHSPFPDPAVDGVRSASEASEVADTSDMDTTYRVRFESQEADVEEAVKQLAALEEVEEVSPNYLRFAQVVPNDPMYATQWGLAKINCPAAWDRTTGSTTVVVAVVDTGIDLNHPDLAANLLPGRDLVDWIGTTPTTNIRINGQDWRAEGDFLTADNSPDDEVGHGTHVAGTISAVSNNTRGVAGVTWNCRLLPVRVLGRIRRVSDGRVTGVGTDADIAAGIRWATDNGARIINLSLGGPGSSFVQRDAVAYALSRGCLVVAAMGNDNSDTPSFPAAYPNVLAVGAVDSADLRAGFSNRGPHIDVVAPGVGIRSTDWDNIYSYKDGTSMAAPHVAGLAALLLSRRPSLTAAEVADIIRQTARNLRVNPGDAVPNNQYGFGLIDASAAMASLKRPIEDLATLPRLDTLLTVARFDSVLTFRESIGTSTAADSLLTTPRTDFVKFPQLDKHPGSDEVFFPDPIEDPIPFVLATPHHADGADQFDTAAAGTGQAHQNFLTQAAELYRAGVMTEEEAEVIEKMATRFSTTKPA